MQTSCALLTVLALSVLGPSLASAQSTSEAARVDQIAREAAQKFADAKANGTAEVEAQTRPTTPPPPPGVRTELTLDGAVERALDRNLDLAVERLTPQTYDFSLAALDATFHPNFISTFGTRSAGGSCDIAFGSVFQVASAHASNQPAGIRSFCLCGATPESQRCFAAVIGTVR